MNLLEFRTFNVCYNTEFDGVEITELMPVFGVSFAPYQRPMLKWFYNNLCMKYAMIQGRDYYVHYVPKHCTFEIFISPGCASRIVNPFTTVSQLARDVMFELYRYADATGRLTLDAEGNSIIIDGPPMTAPE
jgi:hypothetical protein